MEIETLDPFKKGSDAAKAMRVPGAVMLTANGATTATLPFPGGKITITARSQEYAVLEASRIWKNEMRKFRKKRKKE